MNGSEFICSEFSISIKNTINDTRGSRSALLAKRGQTDQASLAETGCTCPATETSPESWSSTASVSSEITASPVTAAAPSMSTSEASSSFNPTASGTKNVVYWGQNGAGTVENNDLATYCNANSGIDIIVLAFLNLNPQGDSR